MTDLLEALMMDSHTLVVKNLSRNQEITPKTKPQMKHLPIQKMLLLLKWVQLELALMNSVILGINPMM